MRRSDPSIVYLSLFSFFVPLILGLTPAPDRAGDLHLAIRGDRVDARIQGAAMGPVLARLGRETGVLVFVDPSLVSRPLDLRFQGLPLEDALKRIAGGESYAMIFAPETGPDGRHPVRAIRVYPKGRSDGGGYVWLNAPPSEEGAPTPAKVLSREEVEALVARNEKITLSHVAGRIADAKNGRQIGNTPGERSLAGKTLDRARRVRELKALKARTLARRRALQAQRAYEFRQTQVEKARAASQQNQAAVTQRSRNSNH